MTDTPVVWLVDDDSDDQLIIRVLLRNFTPSVRIKTLHDGNELLYALQQADPLPKLILLDLHMKHMDGFKALQQVRAQPAFQALPIVVLTNSVVSDDREEAIRLGANGFLSKFNQMAELSTQLKQLMIEWGILP
jgi:CheY-like chemotaxis protein